MSTSFLLEQDVTRSPAGARAAAAGRLGAVQRRGTGNRPARDGGGPLQLAGIDMASIATAAVELVAADQPDAVSSSARG